MSSSIKVFGLVFSMALCVHAQSLVSYASPGAQDYGRALTISPAALGGGMRGTAPTIPILAATGFPFGGAAVDQQGHRFFYTNGVQLACMPIPTVQPGIGPFGFLPMPPFFNQITGMAYSQATGCLWITDGWFIGEYNFGAGVFVTGPWPSPYAGTPIRLTGLDFDSATGNVVAVSEFSNLLHFTPGGALLSNNPPTYVPPGLATGLAIEGRGFTMAGTAFSIAYVSYNNTAVLWNNGATVPLSMAQTQGLAFVALPADLPQGAICPGMPMDAWQNSPSYVNNAGFQLELQGGPPLSVVILGVDIAFLPVPILLPSGSNLWLNPASMTLIVIPLPTNIAGSAFLAAPLFLPPGFTAFTQWAAICPMGGLLYTSDMLQIMVSMP
ncbi:MAG: hypothetical protein EXS14_06225 [Planctomycetes bacterium]|nr:hypothetical protein [Planctomycetota bacterium]